MSYFATGHEPGSVSTDPALWFRQRISYFGANILEWLSVSRYLPLVVVPAAVVAWRRAPSAGRWLMGVWAWHILSVLAVLSLTPYRYLRYFSLAHLETWLLGALVLGQLLPERAVIRTVWWWSAVVLFVVHEIGIGLPKASLIWRPEQVPARTMPGQLAAALPTSGPVFVGSIEAERFAWFTGRSTIFVPRNWDSDHEGFRAWLQHFRPTHLAVPVATVQQLELTAKPLAEAEGWVLIETGLTPTDWIAASKVANALCGARAD